MEYFPFEYITLIGEMAAARQARKFCGLPRLRKIPEMSEKSEFPRSKEWLDRCDIASVIRHFIPNGKMELVTVLNVAQVMVPTTIYFSNSGDSR